MTQPVHDSTQVQQSLDLIADALVDLYRIQLIGAPGQPSVRLTTGPTVTWQGNTYETAPIKMSGDSRSADEQRNRPRLTMLDTAGLLVEYAFAKYLDYARVTRYRILRQHLEANMNLYQSRLWYVSRVAEVITGQSVSVELRSMSDGPLYMLPARKFSPPEFPFVTL